LARKPSSSSNRPTSRKRKVHPRRTGIVWSVFIGAMTLAGGALMLNDDWKAVPAWSLRGSVEIPNQAPIEPGRWQAIVIHHSGSHMGSAEEITRQQQRDWGFPSMGYHFVIGNGNGEHNGSIIEGPRWMLQQSGAHVADRGAGAQPDAGWFNENSIGICLIGNGERRAFTDAQMKALMTLVRSLQAKCGIPSSAVFMHSDLVQVASPGVYFPRETFSMALD
jgi:hypothetical protein